MPPPEAKPNLLWPERQVRRPGRSYWLPPRSSSSAPPSEQTSRAACALRRSSLNGGLTHRIRPRFAFARGDLCVSLISDRPQVAGAPECRGGSMKVLFSTHRRYSWVPSRVVMLLAVTETSRASSAWPGSPGLWRYSRHSCWTSASGSRSASPARTRWRRCIGTATTGVLGAKDRRHPARERLSAHCRRRSEHCRHRAAQDQVRQETPLAGRPAQVVLDFRTFGPHQVEQLAGICPGPALFGADVACIKHKPPNGHVFYLLIAGEWRSVGTFTTHDALIGWRGYPNQIER